MTFSTTSPSCRFLVELNTGGAGYGDFHTDDEALRQLHEPLRRLRHLRRIILQTARVTDEGFEELCKALPHCDVVEPEPGRIDRSNS